MRHVKHTTCHSKTFNLTKTSPKTLKPDPNHAQIGMEPAIMQETCQDRTLNRHYRPMRVGMKLAYMHRPCQTATWHDSCPGIGLATPATRVPMSVAKNSTPPPSKPGYSINTHTQTLNPKSRSIFWS